jgi:hypothetical protein
MTESTPLPEPHQAGEAITIEKNGFSKKFELFGPQTQTQKMPIPTMEEDSYTVLGDGFVWTGTARIRSTRFILEEYDAFSSQVTLDLSSLTLEGEAPIPPIVLYISATPHIAVWTVGDAIAPFTPKKARHIDHRDLDAVTRAQKDDELQIQLPQDTDTLLHLIIATHPDEFKKLSMVTDTEFTDSKQIYPSALAVLKALRLQLFFPEFDGLETMAERWSLDYATGVDFMDFYPFDTGPLPQKESWYAPGYRIVLPTNPLHSLEKTGLEKVQQIKARFRLETDLDQPM